MTAERFQKIKAIVADASEEQSPSKRAELVARRCGGDQTLVREVESLLAETTGTMERYAENAAGGLRRDSAPLAAGRRIGAYAIVRELGRGGMGAVYLAARADQEFQKEVAIKLLKRGTDTDEVLRRFRAEREILARLEHPNIARLIDGGTTEDGLPYFVMEYVAGWPVTDFCAAKAMALEERLRLFLKICAAVQFAHQNLIVHRDLKPANILITAEGEPKLLDFGIAKLLAPSDGALTLTIVDQQRLTPAYASPEQVRGDPITTVSDVYALGALLYEMLSGENAHRFSNVHPSPTELLRVVGEEIPLQPSAVAADSSTARRLHGDLDNIVLKALRKEPARRYPDVGSLAEDVRRHLENFPVRARKDTLGYRTAKFLRRNKLKVAAAAVLVLTLLGGVVTTALEARIAIRERARAERRFKELRGFANSFIFEIDDAIQQGPTQARKILVQRAQEYLDRLLGEAANDLSLQRELATAYQKLGDVESQLNRANIGHTAGALDSYRKALTLRETLFAARLRRDALPRVRDMRKHVPPDDAASLRLELSRSYRRLGDILAKTGNTAEALTNYRKTLPLLESPAARPMNRSERLELASSHEIIGRTLLRTGDVPGAAEHYHSALAIIDSLVEEKPDDPASQLEKANTYSSLGYLRAETGQKQEALGYYRKTHAITERLAAADPTNPQLRRRLIDSHWWLGIGLADCADNAGALQEYHKALALCELALRDDPANVQTHNDLADILNSIGDALFLQRDATGALERHRLAKQNYETVATADPLNIHAQRQVWYSEQKIANALVLAGDLPAALTKLRETLTAFQQLAASDPANTEFQRDEAICNEDIGEVLAKMENAAGAAEYLRKALRIFENLTARSPTSAEARGDVSRTKIELAEVARQLTNR